MAHIPKHIGQRPIVLWTKKFNPLPHFLVWGILLSLSVIMFSYKTAQESQDIRGRAEDDDPNFCQNKCAGRDRCDLNNPAPNDDPNYNDPCCQEIARTGDPSACSDWVKRGYCTVDQCNAIPEGVNRQRCGGPRWHWCELCKEHNCPGYGGSSPVQPTAAPTSVPVIPTKVSVPALPFPTETPTIVEPTTPILPTQIIQIPRPTVTYVPVVFPTAPPLPTLTPTSTPKKIILPQILPPREKVTAFFDRLKTQLMTFLTNILP